VKARRPQRVLFACVGNSARSQMAEGFGKALGLDCRSGGSQPLGYVLPEAVEAMREVGVDISGHQSRGFDEAWIRGCDLVVTMGCGEDACPAFVGKRIVDWDLPDPKGQGMEVFRAVRDRIAVKVKALVEGRKGEVSRLPGGRP
jgi:arsenate reductase (thioredoxin)